MIHQSTEKRKHAETGALGQYCTTVGKFIQQPLQTEKLMEMNNEWMEKKSILRRSLMNWHGSNIKPQMCFS